MIVRPWARRLLTAALVGAAVVFLGQEIYRNADQLRSFDWEVRPGLLAVSVAALSVVLLWGVAVWQLLLRRFGARVSFRALARTWFLANLSRYIPGVVWQFVSLAQLGPSAGLSPMATLTTLLVQMGFLLLSAGLVSIYMFPVHLAGHFAEALRVLRWIAPLVIVLVHPRVIRFALNLFGRVARRPVLEWGGSWPEGIGILALSATSWVFYGGVFYLFLAAFVPIPIAALPMIIAVNAIAFIAGYLAFFAPGGLGFKEGAMAILLSTLMPGAVAASLAIAARLWTIAAEVIPAAFLLRQQAPVASSEEPS